MKNETYAMVSKYQISRFVEANFKGIDMLSESGIGSLRQSISDSNPVRNFCIEYEADCAMIARRIIIEVQKNLVLRDFNWYCDLMDLIDKFLMEALKAQKEFNEVN